MYLTHYLYGLAAWRGDRVYVAIGGIQDPTYAGPIGSFGLIM